jgi:hypothetical protein
MMRILPQTMIGEAIGEGPIFQCDDCETMFSSKTNMNHRYAQDYSDQKKGSDAPHRQMFQTVMVAERREAVALG